MEGGRPIYYKEAAKAVRSWNKYKFAICMRFHSLVLSILNDVPAIPIAYGHKTFILAEKCGPVSYTHLELKSSKWLVDIIQYILGFDNYQYGVLTSYAYNPWKFLKVKE